MAELHADLQRLTVRTADALAGAGAAPDRVLRAHCALGALTAGWEVCLRGADGTAPGSVSDAALEVVLDAALAGLG